MVLEQTLESPLDCKKINQSIVKKINPEYSLERLVLKLKLQYLDHLIQWLDSINNSIDMHLSKPWKIVKDKEAWFAVESGVEESETT